VASQKGGRWGPAGTIPGLPGLATGGQAEVNSLSCATSGSCGLVGDYFTPDSQQPFVVSGSVDAPTTTTMTLSAASVVYGREQAERVSVNVDDVFGSVPTGTVTIKAGNTVACTITLKSRKGSCALTAKEFKPGTYQLTASYPGKGGFTGSASPPKTLKVAK
jgi:hypothetical protein